MSWGVALRNGVALGLGSVPALNSARLNPALSLDFIAMSSSGVLSPTVTFSRASLGWYYNSAGNITQSQANLLAYSNQFDNAAWTKSNSFVQTNLLLQSQTFDNASWNKQNVTISADVTQAPNGTVTADELVASFSTLAYVQQSGFTASTLPLTFSVYLKQSATDRGAYLLINDDTASSTIADLVITSLTSGGTDAGNGWRRYTVTGTPPTPGNSLSFRIYPDKNAVCVANVSRCYVWGAQLVQGSVPGDYRATTSAALPVLYTDYAGNLAARKLSENAANAQHVVLESVTTTATAYTFSMDFKAGERNWAFMQCDNPACGRYFNLATGALGTATGAGGTSTITAIGNGWYRCTLSFTGVAATPAFYVMTASADNTSLYTGDGSSGIYISRSMLDYGSTVGAYLDNATASAYYAPRFDYDPVTLQPKGLLIEESRKNLVLNATLPASNLATQNVTVNAVAHTLSFYGTGTVTLSGVAVGSLVGSGAYPTRSTLTFTPTAGVLTLTVTGTVQFGQLEEGAFATSFIVTGGSQVTRAADVASVNTLTPWFNASAGTLLAETQIFGLGVATASGMAAFTDGSANNNVGLFRSGGANNITGEMRSGAVTQATYAVALGTQPIKTAFAFEANNSNFAMNGTAQTVDTLCSVPTGINKLNLGSVYVAGDYPTNGWLRRIAYYNTRLPDAKLQALTA